MKIALSRYKRAKQMLPKLKEYRQTVETWERAVREAGDLGDQEVIAVVIGNDGAVTTICRARPAEKNHPEDTGTTRSHRRTPDPAHRPE